MGVMCKCKSLCVTPVFLMKVGREKEEKWFIKKKS